MSASHDSTDIPLLLVTGAGRSGTSTVAGSLSRLGFAVPQPEVPADDTNPRGFYEPQWVVDFHKRILGEFPVRTNDARPAAVSMAAEAAGRPELHAELTNWLAPLAHRPTVVKDPRTFWLHSLWRHAAVEVGFSPAFLTMLRPPAEVARSRDQHYLHARNDDIRRARETTNVASWCHGMLITERVTRGDRRTFVRYHDLMSDWRAALRDADQQLGTDMMKDVTNDPHPIDEFIDPDLNRSRGSWEDLSVPRAVTDLADEVWAAVDLLVTDPLDKTATSALDDLHERYNAMYTVAHALTLDEVTAERSAHQRARKEMREKQRARVAKLKARVADLQRQNAALSRQLKARETPLAVRVARRFRT